MAGTSLPAGHRPRQLQNSGGWKIRGGAHSQQRLTVFVIPTDTRCVCVGFRLGMVRGGGRVPWRGGGGVARFGGGGRVVDDAQQPQLGEWAMQIGTAGGGEETRGLAGGGPGVGQREDLEPQERERAGRLEPPPQRAESRWQQRLKERATASCVPARENKPEMQPGFEPRTHTKDGTNIAHPTAWKHGPPFPHRGHIAR